MRHLRGILGATVLLLVLVAAPATAKPWHGDESEPVAVITISGSVLDGPILVNGDRAWQFLYLSTFRGVGLAGAEPPPADRLGPELEARYRFVLTSGTVQTLRQTLYPCGPDSTVWTFTPSGQDRVHQRIGPAVVSGWWHSVALAGRLEDAGLREVCGPRDALALGGPSVGGGSLAGLWAGLAALLLFVVIGALGLRAQRKRQPVGA